MGMKGAGSNCGTEGSATRDLRHWQAYGWSSGIGPENVAGGAREFRCLSGQPLVPSLIGARSVRARGHRGAMGMEPCHPQQVELHDLQPKHND